jgi:hypothetical protein
VFQGNAQVRFGQFQSFRENSMQLRTLGRSASRILALSLLGLIVPLGAAPTQNSDDLRYLLVRRAGTPEKNYYEFARRVVGMADADLEFQGWLDVETEDPGSMRYGVYKIYQARVVREMDSEKQPASAADGAFVLIYRRDPDLKFCARRYRFEREPSGERKITYTDFEDGREYSFRMTKNWPRPFVIYVVEVFPANLLHDVWQKFHQK